MSSLMVVLTEASLGGMHAYPSEKESCFLHKEKIQYKQNVTGTSGEWCHISDSGFVSLLAY